MTTNTQIRASQISPIDRAEAERLSADMGRGLSAQLKELSPEDWDKPTDCDLWNVRDHLAHLVGWNEALISFKELFGQMRGAVGRTKELGNIIDAQNQVQVDSRKDRSTDQLLARYSETFEPAATRRRRLSTVLGPLPVYSSYLGGWINVSYVTNMIFLRDIFVHRIDIARATGRELKTGEPERRVIEDMVRDWFARTEARVTLELRGPSGGTFVGEGEPIATLRADAIEFTRKLFGRATSDVIEISGDRIEAERVLGIFFPV